MKRLIITNMEFRGRPCRISAMDEDGRLIQLSLEPPGKNKLLGSIHVGKVQRVLPDIGSAFVEIENRVACFYPYTENHRPIYTNEKKSTELKAGDELLVQVTQEALRTKAPKVSCSLSFPGVYLVLTTGDRSIGLSGKLSSEKRYELKHFLEEQLGEEHDFGVIVRTNAENASHEELLLELKQLKQDLTDTIQRGSSRPCYTRIRDGADWLSGILKNVYWDDLETTVTDDPDVYQTVTSYMAALDPALQRPVRLYQDPLLPLYKLYRLEHGISQALDEKIWLSSGGFLIIQQTEACVVIDVNSGKKRGKTNAKEEAYKTNLEAAKEIARQMSLRNLYGIILVDFINMNQEGDRELLIKTMRKLVKQDRVSTTVVDITPLGIMEITRKKAAKSVREQFDELMKGGPK